MSWLREEECCDQLVMSAMSTERESRPMPLPALMLKNTRNLRQETLLTVPLCHMTLGKTWACLSLLWRHKC